MIIVFHSLYFVVRYALQCYHRYQEQQATRRRSAAQVAEPVQRPTAVPLDPEECFVFPIPVYRQRYATVQDVLLDPRWRIHIKKVVDFGCAEFGFFQYLKHLIGVTNVLEVDIDELLLKENMFRVQPLTADFLKQRSDPLTVELLRGSISEPDWRIKGIDAVVAIELIEHLYPDTLEALPYNIFGYAQPKVAIFTTPNADFNVLFPNFKGFRHDDHKFEWTREQFQAWASNITVRFPNYTVDFAGIGKGPEGTESLGCCSQMAIFSKMYDITTSEVPELDIHACKADNETDWRSFGICTNYSFSVAKMTLLADDLLSVQPKSANTEEGNNQRNNYYQSINIIKYPYTEDVRTPQEKLLHEAQQQIFLHASANSRYFNVDTGVVEIPLYEVVHNFNGHFATEAEIKTLLEAANFTIAECKLYGTDERCLCVRYDVDMASNSSKTASDYEPSEHNHEVEDDDVEAWNDRVAQSQPIGEDVVLHHHHVNSSIESDGELDDRAMRMPGAKDEAATPSDALVDSGYQKSLSNAEWSPQSPIDMQFEEQFVPKMDVNDIKDSIKGGNGAALKFPPQAAQSSPGGGGTSKAKSPTAGTSRRRKIASYGGGRRSESDDSSSAKEDVKSIADLLMYNSLNKLNIVDDPDDQPQQAFIPVERPQDLEIPQFIVENGDLANNNRDGEGNNIPEVAEANQQQPELPANDVGEDPNENGEVVRVDEDEANRNVQLHAFVNPDDGIVADVPPPPLPQEAVPPPIAQIPVLEIIDVHHAQMPQIPIAEDEEVVNRSSREVLFDPNSETDLLEDGFLTDDTLEFEPESDAIEPLAGQHSEEEESVPVNNVFPSWLLQLLRCASVVAIDVDEDVDVENDDEPHFYCQGDGLGVHPSVVDVDIDTASNSSSTDEAQAEQTISENDVRSLPTDRPSTSLDTASIATMAIFGHAVDFPFLGPDLTSSNLSQDSAGEEFYDSIAEEPSSSPSLHHDPSHDKETRRAAK